MTAPIATPLPEGPDLQAHRAEAEACGVAELVSFVEVRTAGATLHVAVAGPEAGDPVLLLHGFPDLWTTWAPQIPALIEAGYRVIMPDQRGYNRSSKPGNLAGYALQELGADALEVLQALGHGEERVRLVGHDWGGAVSWWLAENHPDRLRTVTVLNCPPIKVLAKAAQSDPRQMAKSWYVLFFQVPWLSERVLASGDGSRLVGALRKGARPGAFSPAELESYRQAWRQPGAVLGMLQWYRATRISLQRSGPSKPIVVPLTLIWGEQDIALRSSLVEPSVARCEDAEVVRFSEAGHWVHRDLPAEVTQALLASLDRCPTPTEAEDAAP